VSVLDTMVSLSANLESVVGPGPLSRKDLTVRFWDYIKVHKLQDKTSPRYIVADALLLPIFGGKPRVSMFEMTRLVNMHVGPISQRRSRSASPSSRRRVRVVPDEEITERVRQSMELPTTQRHNRISAAPRLPARIKVEVTVFDRNPDVAAEVLLRANGRCEQCNQKAPFLRASDGSPYLEVHHRRRLADGGEDVVENTVALCPNCHRKEHYG